MKHADGAQPEDVEFIQANEARDWPDLYGKSSSLQWYEDCDPREWRSPRGLPQWYPPKWAPASILVHYPPREGRWFWVREVGSRFICPVGSILLVPRHLTQREIFEVEEMYVRDYDSNVIFIADCHEMLMVCVMAPDGRLQIREEILIPTCDGVWEVHMRPYVSAEVDTAVNKILTDPEWQALCRRPRPPQATKQPARPALSESVQREIDELLGPRAAVGKSSSDDGPASSAADDPCRPSLHTAAASGDVGTSTLLLDQGARVDTADWSGLRPLHVAAQHGHAVICELLLRRGADVDARTRSGRTPLHSACFQGHTDAAAVLLAHGADVDVCDQERGTPLIFAAQEGHTSSASFLLERSADASMAGSNRRTPLHYAAQQGHLTITQMLLQHGVDPQPQDRKGLSPLHAAAVGGHTGIVDLLIEYGAGVDIAETDGWIPLLWAAQEGHLPVCQILLRHGANANARDELGRT
ncbi:MAG: ankyrin repeat domain-containing protein, partial [Armatimonadia bacterium]